MAAFNIRGDGLAIAQRALVALEEDPYRLDRARARFSHSPPYSSHSQHSHHSTRSQSLDSPSEAQRRIDELIKEKEASLPREQFAAQQSEEENRITEAHENRTCRVPVGTNLYQLAQDNVKKRWAEQGIWNKKWDDMASGRWKHEEPLEEPEADMGARSSFLPNHSQSDTGRLKFKDVAERRATSERDREASRPFHQFIYQVSMERGRIEAAEEGISSHNINSRAYENVKNTWIQRHIWNAKWGLLPGMFWKHEENFEEGVTADFNPIEELTGASALVDLAGSSNGHVARPTNGFQVSKSNARKDRRARVPSRSVSSKALAKGRPASPPFITPNKIQPAAPSLFPRPVTPDSLNTAAGALRRSDRIRQLVSSKSGTHLAITPKDSLQQIFRSEPNKISTGQSSAHAAKPLGISKQRHSRDSRQTIGKASIKVVRSQL